MIRSHAPARADADAGDDELVAATRAGDAGAYGILWDRHAPAALRAARAITRSIDPEDLVSEAFAKTLSAIRNGGGPTDAFRPYLFAAVRSAAATWGGKQKDIALEYIDELPVDEGEDSLDVLSDKALLAAAFKELPERWRTLLWYLEVEGMKPREIAPLMGLTPNAVSVLASRAREGFKTAWLQAHISEPGRDAECRWACERIVARERRRKISRADRERFETHLEGCRRCTMASTEIAEASSKLRAVLLPLVLGGAAAAAYSAGSATPASAGVTLAVGADATTRSVGPWLIASGTIAAVAVAVAVVAVASQFAPTMSPVAVEAIPVASASAALPVAPSAVEATPSPILAAPAPPMVDAQVPGDEPVDPVRSGEAPRLVAGPPAAPQPVPAATPSAEPAAPSAPSTKPAGSPPQVGPAVVVPSDPPVDPPVSPLMLSWSTESPAAVPPPITGTGTPGAEVTVLDESGLMVARTLVDAAGRFSVQPDPDALHQGMWVQGRHADPAGQVTASDLVGPFTFDTPALAGEPGERTLQSSDSDYDGASDDLEIPLEGIAGAAVGVVLDGDRTTTVTLDDGSGAAVFEDVRPGLHRVSIRYTDPESGAGGPAVDDTITLRP